MTSLGLVPFARSLDIPLVTVKCYRIMSSSRMQLLSLAFISKKRLREELQPLLQKWKQNMLVGKENRSI